MNVLVTGAAGFIGFHLSTRLLERGTPVVGFDGAWSWFVERPNRASDANRW